MDEITVLLTDDHAIVRQGVRAFLETQSDIKVVGEAGSGEEAIQLCEALAPDIVLMDLLMPGMGGVEATRRVKAISPRTRVIVLTSYHEDEHVLPAIRAGALSYLLKDVAAGEIATAIRKAAAGEVTLSPAIAAQMMKAVTGERKSPEAPGPESPLTVREREVIRLIADGLSNTEIAERLFLSEKTVKSHVSNILAKLHVTDRTQAAVYAWREGIMTR
ncbi:response regulator transcription factor [Armatimonas sp.]|uniref:response regulator transcription factor n=1 Tax=Armatimonas sp. TaxID=1872638 RepID=UPI00286A515C|nr:response regulator transcription factor [Armatimonas sp.]